MYTVASSTSHLMTIMLVPERFEDAKWIVRSRESKIVRSRESKIVRCRELKIVRSR
jgi:hypothetical protein